MNLTVALSKINNTVDGNTKVMLEFVAYDASRKEGGYLKSCVGRKTKASHDSREHGTVVIIDDSGNYHTVHVALLMKVNNEFVD